VAAAMGVAVGEGGRGVAAVMEAVGTTVCCGLMAACASSSEESSAWPC
jgi:hypothetical protein